MSSPFHTSPFQVDSFFHTSHIPPPRTQLPEWPRSHPLSFRSLDTGDVVRAQVRAGHGLGHAGAGGELDASEVDRADAGAGGLHGLSGRRVMGEMGGSRVGWV